MIPKNRWLIVEIASLLALLFNVAVVLVNYSSLPPAIPAHFSWNGAPNGLDDKSTLLDHLFVLAAAFTILSVIRFKSAVAWCRVIKLEWMILHGYLIWAIVQLHGLNPAFHNVLLTVILATVLFALLRNAARRVDNIILIALATQIALVIRGWEPVRKAHLLTHNTLGSTNIHVPTADLFLWTACAVIFFFGTKMWAALAPHVFALSPERATPPTAPIFLLHGVDDNVIPSVETVLLAEHLKGKAQVKGLLSGLITHAEVNRTATSTEVWRLASFWRAIMAQ